MPVVERQREYETVFILRPNIGEEDHVKTHDRVKGIIDEAGGHLLRVDDWGLRKLAYEMRDRGNAEYHDRGQYAYYRYLAPPATVAEIERNLRILDTVLKYLTVKLADDLIPADRKAEGAVKMDIDVYEAKEEEE